MPENFIQNPIELNQLILERKGWFPSTDNAPCWDTPGWVDPVLGETGVPVTDSPPPFCYDFLIAWKHILQPLSQRYEILTFSDFAEDTKQPRFMVAMMDKNSLRIRQEFYRSGIGDLSELIFLTTPDRWWVAPTMPLAICLAYLKSEGINFHLTLEFEDELWKLIEQRR